MLSYKKITKKVRDISLSDELVELGGRISTSNRLIDSLRSSKIERNMMRMDIASYEARITEINNILSSVRNCCCGKC